MMGLDTDNLLADGAGHVLEAMFFTSVEPEPAGDLPAPTIQVKVAFHGELTGHLEVHLDDAFARVLAGNFTGNFDPSEMSETDVAQVMRELANMLCGATLSRLSPGTIFDLDAPQVSAADTMPEDGQWVHTGDGSLHLRLHREIRGTEL